MPIVNGTWVNWTIENQSAGLQGIVQTVSINLPWFFPLFLVCMYVALFIILLYDESRKKFISICFPPMIMSYMMVYYGYLPYQYSIMTTFLMGLAIFFAYLTS